MDARTALLSQALGDVLPGEPTKADPVPPATSPAKASVTRARPTGHKPTATTNSPVR